MSLKILGAAHFITIMTAKLGWELADEGGGGLIF
jgi:hypothetical protein